LLAQVRHNTKFLSRNENPSLAAFLKIDFICGSDMGASSIPTLAYFSAYFNFIYMTLLTNKVNGKIPRL
jgi:hypothetical protein